MVTPIIAVVYELPPKQINDLLRLLKEKNFTSDGGIRNVGAGVDAYISTNGSDKTLLTLDAGTHEFGIHPGYLDALVYHIQKEGVELREKSRRDYPYRQYDWDVRQELLAGYGHF